jgi:hypothetical protein
MRRRTATLLSIGLTVVLITSACTGEALGPADAGRSTKITQPTVHNLPVAPASQRLDMKAPSFSDSTIISNPLFPVSRQESVLLLGRVEGKPFRTEITLLPETRVIEWQGQRVETLISQYVAYLDGRIHEVAYDYYAQADDGSVWYFGEDVFNFDDGAIADTEGTWLAGRDGPAAMIMPADPGVGDTYRPENIPGLVFEEVTVKSVDQTLTGPLGSIDGGLIVEELHMDGSTEDKTFAPGYGEFYTAADGEVEALALAVPTDASTRPAPEELENLLRSALAIFDAAGSKDWNQASAVVRTMKSDWNAYKTGDVPAMIEPQMTGALATLTEEVDTRNVVRTRQAAIDAAQWSLDLQLRHRHPVEINLARFDLWAARVLVDASKRDSAAVKGDLFTLDYIRDRIMSTLNSADAIRINTLLEELQSAVSDEDFAAAADAARRLRDATQRSKT